jgi:hypothetical protein
MSRAKWLLAGATLALVLITLWAVRDFAQRTGYVAHQEKLFPDLPAQAAAARRIEIRSAGAQVTLRGSGADWKVVDKHDFPADPAKVRALLEGLSALTLLEPRTADPARHAALDLDVPDRPGARGVLVRVLGENDAVLAAVLLGKPRVAAGQGPRQMFVRRPDENQTWLAEGAVDAQRSPPLWLRSEAFDLPQASVRAVSIQHPGEAPLLIARDAPDAAFALRTPLPTGRTARASAVGAVAYGLQRLPLQNVFVPDEVVGDWAQATTVAFDTFDGLTVTARVLSLNGVPHVQLAAAVAADAGAERRAAAVAQAERINHDHAGWVYVVPPHTTGTFTPRLHELLEPLPAPAEPRAAMPPGMAPGP